MIFCAFPNELPPLGRRQLVKKVAFLNKFQMFEDHSISQGRGRTCNPYSAHQLIL